MFPDVSIAKVIIVFNFVKGFQSKLEPEYVKWKNLMHGPSGKSNLITGIMIPPRSLIYRRMETYFLTNKHPPRISCHTQANGLTAWTLAG